jgi:hypothetical protein
MLIVQKINNLLNGVSQRPATQRLPSQAEEQINGVSHLARGVMKRPPSRYIGTLTNTVTGWDNAFIHIINRDEDERYHVVIANGDIQVFDAVLGTSVPVTKPDGVAYLDNTPGKGFRAVTVGDTTIITNRGIYTAKGTKRAPAAKKEALVFIRQADFSTLYRVVLNGTAIQLRTLDQDTSASRQSISTDAIADDLLALLKADAGLNANFTFTPFGGTIYITRNDGADFTLSTADGLADQGIRPIKGTVQMFSDLPPRAPNGFIVEVTGDIDTAKDNFFVQYDDRGLPDQQGIWREVPKPGTLLNLDKPSMPHMLSLRGRIEGENKQLVNEGLPPAPTAVGFQTLVVPPGGNSWQITLPDLGAILANFTQNISWDGGGARFTLAQDIRQFQATYDITLPGDPGVAAWVRLYKNGVKQAERYHDQAGSNGSGTYALGFGAASNTDVIEINLEMAFGGTQQIVGPVTLTLRPNTISMAAYVSRRFQIVDSVYPVGSNVTITLDGANVFSHNVVTADETAAVVAAALSAAIGASATYDLVAGSYPTNVFVVRRTDGADFTVAFSGTFPTDTNFHNSTMALTPSAFVGKVLKNLTDGSSGTITANTATTITVGALTGGALNSFRAGDVCVIVVSVAKDAKYFVFQEIPWKEREAGDTDVVTFPSFMDSPVSDVFFYQNRLGFLSRENIVFSSSGDLFNLFRYTATDLRPDDAIDVRSAHAAVTIFDSAFLWSDGLYVKSDNVWFRVSGLPALTPTTIRLDPVGEYLSSHDPRPVVVGDNVYFTRKMSDNTQVFKLSLEVNGKTTVAADITKELPTFVQGKPLAIVGDVAQGLLAVLTDTLDKRRLYVYSWLLKDGEQVISSWSYWEFPSGTHILGLDMADGVLGFVRKHADGAYFEQVNFDLTADANEKIAYLDRRLGAPAASYNAGTDATTWTLPYSVATDGSEGAVSVVNRATSVVYVTTRPTATTVRVTGQGNLVAASVYVGQPYRFTWTPTGLFFRRQDQQPETGGRLQVRHVELFYTHTTDFTVTVSPNGRTPIAYLVTKAAPGAGSIKFPVLCRNTEVTITVTNETPGPCALSELDWEGWFTSRDKRV